MATRRAGGETIVKALLSTTPGGPETLTLEDRPSPQPGAGQVRIDVRAVGVNFPDTLIIEDRYQFRPPRPFSPGGEAAGVIAALGAGVQGFAPGDRVIASPGWGCMAEEIVVDAARCTPIPQSMAFDEAAAFLFTYGTSWHALKQRAALKAGETLLVLGAAGGVGLAAVELGAAVGARVVAAVSSDEKAELARASGAAEAVIYPRGPFDREGRKALSAQFKAACGEGGADVIYDAVGGDYAEAALRAIAWEGRFLVVGFPAGIPAIPLNLPLLKSCSVVGVFWGGWVAREPAAHAQNVGDLFAFHAQGKVRPHICARYPLARGGEAIRALADRRALGKVVVTVGG